MRKCKITIIITILVFIILVFSAWIYLGWNGLPWKIRKTETMTLTYLKEKYPDLEYEIEKAHYNPKFGYYFCNVITEGYVQIKFHVIVDGNNNIEDNYYESKVNTEAKNMIISLLQNNTPYIKQISVLSDAGPEADKGSYEKYDSFIPGNAYPLKIDIIWNDDNMSLDTFVDKTLIVRDILKNNNISVCGLNIQDDANKYLISLNGRVINGKMEGNYNFTKDEIIKSNIVYKGK